jgi:hypothetical protein
MSYEDRISYIDEPLSEVDGFEHVEEVILHVKDGRQWFAWHFLLTLSVSKATVDQN